MLMWHLVRVMLGFFIMLVGCLLIPTLKWFPVLALCFGGWAICGGWEWRVSLFDQSNKPLLVGIVSSVIGGLSLLI
ncbi:MAG: hypothetical protein RLZZ422_1486 [Pseudomonadota bacterium]|jgi:hypothetical protein